MELTVKKVDHLTLNYIHLTFHKPIGYDYYPAQFVDLIVKTQDKIDSRNFTLSSSPTEDYLSITFKKGVSNYKKGLERLKPGTKVPSTFPIGTYTLMENYSAVMIAGGVGVTPHRSMIKYALDKKLSTPITLIYSSSEFLFQDEFKEWKKAYPKLNVTYIDTTKQNRLNKELLLKLVSKRDQLNAIFYLAGPPKMVDDFERILLDLKLNPTSIRTDRFDGY